MIEQYFWQSDSSTRISAYKWTPNVEPVCAVVISHGMAECIERYNDFAMFLNANSMVVYGHSHRGHGLTAVSQDALGVMKSNDWVRMRRDLLKQVRLARKENPRIPVILFAHSMGSFLARDLLLSHSKEVDAVILSGTGFPKVLELVAGKTLARIECYLKGWDYGSKQMDKLIFKGFNHKIHPCNTDLDWLSRDAEKVKEYLDNPYCGKLHSSGFYYEFLSNLHRILYKSVFKNKKKHLPLLFVSGNADPVGQYGVGVMQSYNYYKNQEFTCSKYLYDGGRHEMLNEINRREVYSDIVQWIQSTMNKR